MSLSDCIRKKHKDIFSCLSWMFQRHYCCSCVVCLTRVEDSSSGVFCDYWPQVCVGFPLYCSLSVSLSLICSTRFTECVGSFKELMRPVLAGLCCPSVLRSLTPRWTWNMSLQSRMLFFPPCGGKTCSLICVCLCVLLRPSVSGACRCPML